MAKLAKCCIMGRGREPAITLKGGIGEREKTKKIEHAVRFDRADGAMMAVIMPCNID